MVDVGVFGSGLSSRKGTTLLLDERYKDADKVRVFVPATVPHFTDTVRFAADWALDKGHEIIFLADDHDLADLEDYGNPVLTQVDDVHASIVAAADDLLAAVPHYGPKDDAPADSAADYLTEYVADCAAQAGETVLDLCDGLWPIVSDGIPMDPPASVASAATEEPVVVPSGDPMPETATEPTEPADEAQATIPFRPSSELHADAQESLDEDALVERITARVTAEVLGRLKAAL